MEHCLVSHDLNKYYMAQERRDIELEHEEALRASMHEDEIDCALYEGKAATDVEFFGSVLDLVMDTAGGNEQVAVAMVEALLKAAKQGEPAAIKAVATIKTTYLRNV
jgi:hypothetical protein